jgi:hypothetical protein
MATQYAVINDVDVTKDAGMDEFFLRPAVDLISGETQLVDVSNQRGGIGGSITSISLDFSQRRSERNAYYNFLQRVFMSVARAKIPPIDISSSVDVESIRIQTSVDPPEGFLSSDIILSGTWGQINHALRKVYYVAPNDTIGDVTLSVEAKDSPNVDCIEVPSPLTASSPLYTFYKNGFVSNKNETDSIQSACPSVSETGGVAIGVSQRSINIRVMHVNQAPEVVLSNSGYLSTQIDVTLTALGVSVYDVDNNDYTGFTSYGFVTSAPVSVKLSAIYGKLSLPNRDGLAMLDNRGIRDSHFSFKGMISDVNAALLEMQYICRSEDGCVASFKDVIQIVVDDGGFYGKGGVLTGSKQIQITFNE